MPDDALVEIVRTAYVATLERERDELREALVEARLALLGNDRIGSGRVVHSGHVPTNAAEVVHLTCIVLEQALCTANLALVRKVKAQIQRHYSACEKAIRVIDKTLEGRNA